MTLSMPILETVNTKLVFALMLRDRLMLDAALAGDVVVTAATRTGLRKGGAGDFVFIDLESGPTVFKIRSAAATPCYRPVDLALVLPVGGALWPAYPDINLADRTLPLASPAQPPGYRAQFLACALSPDIAYPFAPEATLIRGVVEHAGAGVADATVFDVAGDALPFVTGPTGEFVLAYLHPPLLVAQATVRVQRQGEADVDVAVEVRRGRTATVSINV
jgi:hypothetical protein